jgi:uncharacterized membrane protein YidH (DUF202 family)
MVKGGSSAPGSSKVPRLRAQALWAFLVSGIGLLATVVGLAQLLLSGAVSIRPGRESLVGSDAVEELIILFLVSACFAAFGFFARSRAKHVRRKKRRLTSGCN